MTYDIGYLIKSINDKLKVKADNMLKEHDLTISQSRVVGFLAQKGGEATQKEIEEFFDVSHPTIVGLVSRMEQNGMLTTFVSTEDRRNKIVKLTPDALLIANDIKKSVEDSEKQLLQNLSDEEVENLTLLLTKVLNNISK